MEISKTKTFSRNSDGLIEDVIYLRHPDGSVNWRAMIRPEHLYINREYRGELEARFNKKLSEINVSEVEDKQLLILLAGLKELARLRGYRSVRQKVDHISAEKAVVTCEIEWIGNYETGGESIVFSDVGAASLYSVSGTFQVHLETIAANRAFVRATRNFLGINIVGKDEFDPKANEEYAKQLKEGSNPLSSAKKVDAEAESSRPSGFDPISILKSCCKDQKISFEKLKESSLKIVEELTYSLDQKRVDGKGVLNPPNEELNPANWTGFESVPPMDAFTLLNKINEATEKKKSKKG